MTHPFDYLNLWDSWEDSKIEKIISDETMAILQEAVDLLDDETKNERTIVTNDNFVRLVHEMRKLYKSGSIKLSEALIKAWEYEERIIIRRLKYVRIFCPHANQNFIGTSREVI